MALAVKNPNGPLASSAYLCPQRPKAIPSLLRPRQQLWLPAAACMREKSREGNGSSRVLAVLASVKGVAMRASISLLPFGSQGSP